MNAVNPMANKTELTVNRSMGMWYTANTPNRSNSADTPLFKEMTTKPKTLEAMRPKLVKGSNKFKNNGLPSTNNTIVTTNTE